HDCHEGAVSASSRSLRVGQVFLFRQGLEPDRRAAGEAGDLAADIAGAAVVALALKWLNGFSLAAIFEGEFSDVSRSYAGKAVARYTWSARKKSPAAGIILAAGRRKSPLCVRS